MSRKQNSTIYHGCTNIAVTRIDLSDQDFSHDLFLVMPLYNIRGVLNWEISANISTPTIFICNHRSQKPLLDYYRNINLIQCMLDTTDVDLSIQKRTLRPTLGHKDELETINIAPVIKASELKPYWLSQFGKNLATYSDLLLDMVENQIDSINFDEYVNSYFTGLGKTAKGDDGRQEFKPIFSGIKSNNESVINDALYDQENAEKFKKLIELDSTFGSCYDSTMISKNRLLKKINTLHLQRLQEHRFLNIRQSGTNSETGYFPVYVVGSKSNAELRRFYQRVKEVLDNTTHGINEARIKTELLPSQIQINEANETTWLCHIPPIKDSFIQLDNNNSIIEQWMNHGLSGVIGLKI